MFSSMGECPGMIFDIEKVFEKKSKKRDFWRFFSSFLVSCMLFWFKLMARIRARSKVAYNMRVCVLVLVYLDSMRVCVLLSCIHTAIGIRDGEGSTSLLAR